jgi:hypothetical protein
VSNEPVVIRYEAGDDAAAAGDLDDLLVFLRREGESELDPYALQQAFPAVAQEPVTAGIAITVGSISVAKALLRLIERWTVEREKTRQAALAAGADIRHRSDADLRISLQRGGKQDVLTIEQYSADVAAAVEDSA